MLRSQDELNNTFFICQGCPPHWWVRHLFGLWWMSSRRSFAVETSSGFPKHFVVLSVIGIQFMSGIVLRLHFGLFHIWGLRTFAHPRTTHGKKIQLCSEAMSCSVLSFLEQHLLTPGSTTRVTVCQYWPNRIVSVRIPEQLMKLQLPLHLCPSFELRELSETRTTRCLQRSFFHTFPPGIPTLFSRTP